MRSVTLAVLLLASVAHANGRGPLTNGVYFKPGDLHSLYVRTTFGLLISNDDGCTFNWVCEDNIGYNGSFDPKYAIATDGSIFATTYDGLRVSRDGGCSFTTATTDIWIDALDIAPTGEIWVATADSTKPNDIMSSIDNGASFKSKGMQSPTIWWKSVKVAPTNPQRVYISGYQVAGAPDAGQTPVGHFLITNDDGAHWTESAMAGVVFGSTPLPLVVAVDPANADLVYMASVGAYNATGDRLYRSTDGGMTFTDVLEAGASVHDVVIRDAQNVLVTTLISTQSGQMGGPSYVSSDGGKTFIPMAGAPQLGCMGMRADGVLIGCGANWDPDFESVAKSTDGGATWTKIWRFVELAGPLSCPGGTIEHDTCDAAQWSTVQQMFGATGPSCGAHQFEGAMDAPPTPPPKKSGCCDAGEGAPIALAWALGLWLVLRRRAS